MVMLKATSAFASYTGCELVTRHSLGLHVSIHICICIYTHKDTSLGATSIQ